MADAIADSLAFVLAAIDGGGPRRVAGRLRRLHSHAAGQPPCSFATAMPTLELVQVELGAGRQRLAADEARQRARHR